MFCRTFIFKKAFPLAMYCKNCSYVFNKCWIYFCVFCPLMAVLGIIPRESQPLSFGLLSKAILGHDHIHKSLTLFNYRLFKETAKSPQDGLYCIRNSGTKTSQVQSVQHPLQKERHHSSIPNDMINVKSINSVMSEWTSFCCNGQFQIKPSHSLTSFYNDTVKLSM